MISDITYEQISGDYWYANYLGFKVVMMKSNGFVNATKLCLSGGKRYDKWARLQNSEELVKFFEEKLFIEDKNLIDKYLPTSGRLVSVCDKDGATTSDAPILDTQEKLSLQTFLHYFTTPANQVCNFDKTASNVADCDKNLIDKYLPTSGRPVSVCDKNRIEQYLPTSEAPIPTVNKCIIHVKIAGNLNNLHTTGTYVHPKLIIHIASWVSCE